MTTLRYQGEEVRPDAVFRLCLSSYRASGAGGYEMYRACKRIGELPMDVAELMLAYMESGMYRVEEAKQNYSVLF